VPFFLFLQPDFRVLILLMADDPRRDHDEQFVLTRFPIPLVPRQNVTHREMSLREIGVEAESIRRCCFRLRKCSSRIDIARYRQRSVCIGKRRVRECISGIKSDCLLIKLDRLVKLFRCRLILKEAAL